MNLPRRIPRLLIAPVAAGAYAFAAWLWLCDGWIALYERSERRRLRKRLRLALRSR